MAIYTTNNKIWKLDNKWVNKPEVVPPGPTFDEVTIGTQTWMAKNLAVDDGGEGITIINNVTVNGINFGTQYYYTWNAAMRVANSIDGWHLPHFSEWSLLEYYVGSDNAGTKLKSTRGWSHDGNGTDDYGFTVIPVGSYISGSITTSGMLAYFWTSNESQYGTNKAQHSSFRDTASYMNLASADKSNGYSVRLIKDS